MKTLLAYIADKSRAIKRMDRGDWILFAHFMSVIVYVVVVILAIMEATR